MSIDRALEIMARPGALRWAIVLYVMVAIPVFAIGPGEVLDRLGYERPECAAPSIEQMRAP